MAFSMTGGKGTSKTKEASRFNETTTRQLSDRASGLLSGGIDSLRGQRYSPVDLTRIQDFQDPYAKDVRDATMAQLGQDRSVAFNQLDDRLAGSSAFGDKRRGIMEAEVTGQFDRTAAATLAGLNSAGYGQALGATMQENAGRNDFDLGLQDLITRLLAQYGNEGTDTRSGTSSGTSSGRNTNLGFSLTPFGKG